MSIISLYPHIMETKKGFDIKMSTFLANIRDGYWQDVVLAYRNSKDKEVKKKLPYVTVSGTFKNRSNSGLEKHSGYIAMDLDGIENVHDLKAELACDPFFYAIFVSCGGSGLCTISKMNPKAHLESFNFLSEHLFKKYGITQVDEHCKDVSRPRFVSYDPDIYINENAQVLHIKPDPAPKKKVQTNYVYVKNDFDNVVNEIIRRGIDITERYADWINIGFCLAARFGESGREYFHALSKMNHEYVYDKADKKYTHLLKTRTTDMNIGVLYNLAKRHNIELYSPETRTAIVAAQQAKKSARSLDSVYSNLEKFSDLSKDQITELTPVIEKAYLENVSIDEQNIIQDIKDFLSNNYNIRRNLISRNIELDGVPITDIELNTIFIDCRSVIEKASKDLVCSVLFSSAIPAYNPFFEFMNDYSGNPKGNIDKLISCIETDTKNYEIFIKKWLVSIIASIHGKHSPLMLVLCGGQNTGKTEFFRRLLPDKLHSYYAEDKLDRGTDSEILMTKKLIIMDDEMGGKSKQEQKKLKEMTSRQTFSIREPYGRLHVDLVRLAMLCGTTNDDQILNDPTGNRRILPINVISINQELFNSINKYHLFIELYNEYIAGYNYNLTKEDIQKLNDSTHDFKASSMEEDIILSMYKKPVGYNYELISATEIVSRTRLIKGVNLSLTKVGQVLKSLGFQKKHVRINNCGATRWIVETLPLDEKYNPSTKNIDLNIF